MKHFACLFFLLLLVSCNPSHGEKDFMCPALDSLLTKYMNCYKYDSIFHLSFVKINGKKIIMIKRGHCYSKYFVDGYFFKDKKLITYCQLNTSIDTGILNVNQTLKFKDTIYHYSECKDFLINDYNSYPEFYTITSPLNIIPIKESSISANRPLAVSKKTIKNEALNLALNNYINQHQSILYYIRFNSIKNIDYASIGISDCYDERYIKGFFFRDGYLVLLYSTEKLINRRIINWQQIYPFPKYNLPFYRKVPLDMTFSPQEKYKITSLKSIEKIPITETNYYINL